MTHPKRDGPFGARRAPNGPRGRTHRTGRLPREDARAGRLGHARVQGPPALGTSPCVHHFAQYFAP